MLVNFILFPLLICNYSCENEKFLMVADIRVAVTFYVNIPLSQCRAVEEYYF